MNRNRTNWTSHAGLGSLIGLSAVLLATLAGTALAQPERGRPEGRPGEPPALRGPEVRDDSVPGQKRRFAPGKSEGKDRLDDRGTPPRLFMQAIRVLKENDTPDDARLTPEQDQKLQAIGNGFRDQMKAYMDQHREEVRDLLEKIGPEARAKVEGKLRAAGFPGPAGKGGPDGRPEGGKGGKRPPRDGGPQGGPDRGPDRGPDGRPDGGPDMKSDGDQQPPRGKPRKEGKPVAEDPAAAQRLKEIIEGAPKFKDAEAQAWAVLTEKQRPMVQDELARLRENGQSRLNPGEGRPPKGGPKGGPNGGPGGGPGGPDAQGGREKLRERLENMSPEEREQMKQKLQERRAKRDAKRGPADGQPKAPPPMEDVDVPPPPPPAPR